LQAFFLFIYLNCRKTAVRVNIFTTNLKNKIMKKTKDITLILDRSGSMYTIKNATIESVNAFLREQKEENPKTSISLVLFDDVYDLVYECVKISDVKYLDDKTYLPRGTTALLDAIGTTIQNTKQRLKNSNPKPEQVLIVIVTDGQENASTKFEKNEIFSMIRKNETKKNWSFIFLGANQDAISESTSLGIKARRALTFAGDANGIRDAFKSVSCCMKLGDSGGFMFDEESRNKQKRN